MPTAARDKTHRFGMLGRSDSVAVGLNTLLEDAPLPSGYGHLDLVYDFDLEGSANAADGWLHALFRYEDRQTGHAADTSFGAHIFNAITTYKSEPQSYGGPPPGLSTRLFLRLGNAMAPGVDTLCHLIYLARPLGIRHPPPT